MEGQYGDGQSSVWGDPGLQHDPELGQSIGEYGKLMQSPQFRQMVQQQASQSKKKKLEDILKEKQGRFAALGKKLPQFKVQRDKMKVDAAHRAAQDAQRKAQESKLDFMISRATESQQMQQKQEQQKQ
jgi:hypothetical protein